MTLSLDALAAAFAYGCKKIAIPPLSAHIITAICTGTTAVSFLFGTAMSQFISADMAAWVAFGILFTIGLVKLLDSITKAIIRKHAGINKEIKLSLLNFKFILRLYADPEAADVDVSRSIDPKEAAVLAVSLSLDGFAVGFGAALLGLNGWVLVLCSLLANSAAIWLGSKLGNHAATKLRFSVSWLAGVVLMGLAFLQLL